ncbi:iron-sulfur cluster assembly accessory protein CYBJADRAFT_24405 [Cyberlindnera jadinii NRRL Y-1542]|uniref:Iron-sulfur assembly protein 1 n=2 Tax=Cyberlindnera jadinii (strain ATCC 18201 / CBS 1600 / BCRC 20928 / JCM 3617 / NBRC 0987 / NRRL Y-1542) TaxID=983966 RepID=A0A1E4RY85_CYBJN|nr:hypothetical protein CYBJADRAFT_24405 [Cyberlindnera jadinii NRRL Y-1542]ODV72239.1 hypothetical protein CYBJADRAFT_24405 [Cyberlindnera jadinii NRRL Y-1542]
MLRTVPQISDMSLLLRRNFSSTMANSTKRFLQTTPMPVQGVSYVPYKMSTQSSEGTSDRSTTKSLGSTGWAKHSLPSRSFGDVLKRKATTVDASTTTTPKKRRRRTLKPRKALITLSPNALAHLKGLLNQPTPQMIRIGVKNRGCSGLTYNLEYIEQPQKFDEVVEQDGVKVVIDSKALFSIVGSEMDWIDDKLSSRFVFKNPNSKGTCGCGESFMV